MTRSILLLSILALTLVSGRAMPQKISGCGASSMPRAQARDAAAMKVKLDCFQAAANSAQDTAARLRTQLAAIAPPPASGAVPFVPTPAKTTSLAGLPSVDDGLDFAALTGPNRIPPKMNDVVGAFRFLCGPGQLNYDDAIIHAGEPGGSDHLHQWFGNLDGNANSTYESLRRHGDSTCMNALNRSAYYIPAMLNGRGQVVRPDNVSIYYKQRPASDPECQRLARGGCVALPRGLRFVFGYNMTTGAIGNGHWGCPGKDGAFATIPEAAKGCAGNQLAGTVDTPMCWNGTDLDRPDHRSHLSYPSYGNWGYPKCPSAYRYVIPQFILTVNYTTDATLARDGSESWYLSSDRMDGMAARPAGLTLHADWFGAWNDRAQAMWQDNCIDKLLDGVDGDLCGGLILARGAHYPDATANPRLVPVPPRP